MQKNTGSGKTSVISTNAPLARVEIKAFREGAVIPQKATQGAAGYDLCACIPDYSSGMMIHPNNTAIIPTGLRSEEHTSELQSH